MQKAKPGYKLVKWFFGKEIEIPTNWNLEYMKQISKVRQGLQIPISERYSESGKNRLQYITVKSIHSNNFEEYIEDAGKRVICNEDDILFTRTGNTGEIITNIKGVFHNNFFLIDYNRKLVIKNYLVYFLKQNKIQGVIRSLSGSTTIPDLNHGDFYRLLITIPPINEQQKITAILSNVDNLISSYSSTIETTKKLKKGLMQQLLTKGIGHKKFKKVKWYHGKKLEIPEEWKWSTFGHEGKLRSGATPRREHLEYYDGKIPWVSSGELDHNVIMDTYEHVSEIAVKKTNLDLYSEGTFLFAITGLEAKGTRGRCAILGIKATTNQSCMAFYGSKTLLPKFVFYYYLLFGEKIIFSLAQGTKQQSLNLEISKSIKIPVPPIEEQKIISSILLNTDKEIWDLKSKKSYLEKIKKGLMQKLLTGQIRVKV